MSLEDLEKQIYSFHKKQMSGKSDESTNENSAKLKSSEKNWEKADNEEFISAKPRTGIKKMFLIFFSAILFIGISAAVAFFIFREGGNPQGVVIEVFGQNEIYRGVPFEVQVQISNEIQSVLRDAKITTTPTQGLVSLDGFTNQTSVSESLGNIGGGSLTKKVYRFLAIGDVNSVQKITFELSYFSEGRAKYETNAVREITIREPAISLEIKKPEQIVGSSEFEIRFDYKNISNVDFPDVIIEAKYPDVFKFVSSDLPATSLNNYWKLGELKAKSVGSIQIKGRLESTDQSSANMPVSVLVNFLNQNYPINEQLVNFAASPSPIKIDILTNSQQNYIARIGDGLRYTIKYQNNSGIALSDAVIKATVSGDLVDFTSVQTSGDFNSIDNSITWTASRIPELRLLEPGGSGEVQFSVKLKPTFSIKRPSDKDFTVKIKTEIDSPSVPYYLSSDKTSAEAVTETKITGLSVVDAKIFYRDAESGIVNSGKLPPQVNKPTQYSIHWVITNYSTDIKSLEIKSSLESGVRWTGISKSNVGSVPFYNERTQEVVWNIDKVSAGRGVITDPVEAIFQIEAIPNITQVGQYMPILEKTLLTATDGFTGLQISAQDLGLSTSLADDKTVQGDAEKRVIK